MTRISRTIGLAADAASSNGSVSTTYEKQRQKVNGGAVDQALNPRPNLRIEIMSNSL